MSRYFKSLVALVTAAVLTFAPFTVAPVAPQTYSIQTQEAQAILGVADVVVDPAHIGTHVVKFIKDNFITFALEQIKQRILAILTREALTFVRNTGGIPRVITDWSDELGWAFDMGFDRFMEEVGATALCSNIQTPTLLTLNRIRYAPAYSYRARCTLDSVVTNINSFLNDFSSGGFVAYESLLLPNNNPRMALMQAISEVQGRAGREEETRLNQSVAANGYRDTRRCEGASVPINYNDPLWQSICVQNDGEVQTTTPGKTTGDQIDSSLDSTIKYTVNIQIAESIAGIIMSYATNAITSNLFGSGEDGLISTGGSTVTSGDPCSSISSSSINYIICQAQRGNISLARSATITELNRALTELTQLEIVLGDLLDCQRTECYCRMSGGACTIDTTVCDNTWLPMSDTYNTILVTQSNVTVINDAIAEVNATSDPDTIIQALFRAREATSVLSLSQAQSQLSDCRSRIP